MLKIIIPGGELFDEEQSMFITTKEQTLTLEHSLVSLSKWESKWEKPFMAKEKRTIEESIDYIRCMTITQNVNPNAYHFLSDANIKEVNEYIELPMTATIFTRPDKKATNREIITAEIIYYWMIALNIPFECQKWHLNKLLTLINVCDIKSQPPKKMSRSELLARNKALNEARRKKLNNKG